MILVYHPKPLGTIIREIEALFMTDKETPVAAILFFKMRPKIFPGNILWLLIYPANLRRLAIIFFSLER